jgi:hypothetical protein
MEFDLFGHGLPNLHVPKYVRGSFASLCLAVGVSVGQHPSPHQLGILSAGWGGISHLVVEYVLTSVDLFGADLFFGFLFPNFEITCPATYYLPSWPYLPTKNQLPPLSPTYRIHTPFST